MHLKPSSSLNRRANRARPITVNFPIPKNAISKLRSLAIEKDPRLVDLGVLAVQISDDESIVLGIELEKSKRKGLAITNDETASSISHSSGGFLGFEALSRRNFESSPSGFYHKPHVTTPARNALSSKNKKSLQNPAIKKRAKETLNAARRGGIKAKSRAGKLSVQLPPAAVKASTWEMVYSHIGVPGNQWRKQSNPPHFEPNLASQASGIANVPVAQPTLPKENIAKGESKKRETKAMSPPHKSPGTGIYSEDDSSVSSSPCSHSPMNEEELLNLFVDQNFSATSILRQLAESRNKGDCKDSDTENSEQKKGSDQSTNRSEAMPGLRTTTVSSDDKTKTDSSNSAVEAHTSPSSNDFNNSTPSGTSNTASMKRPSPLAEKNSSSVSWSNLFENPAKRQKRNFHDLETKKEMVGLSYKVLEQEKRGQSASLGKQTKNTKIPAPSSSQSVAKTPNQSVALRNFTQYGYYYTAEDLKALGSKALSFKSVNKATSSKANKNDSAQQNDHSLNTSAGTSSNAILHSTSANLHTQVKAQAINNQDNLSTTSSTSIQTISPQQHVVKESFNLTCSNVGMNQDQLKNEVNSNAASPEDVCVSSSNDRSVHVITSLQSTSAVGSTSETTALLSCDSSATISKKQENMSTDVSMNLRRAGGQCYALSYVYPMGSVWYPYVAITPYAVLNESQKKDPECSNSEKEKENATEGLTNHSQYIDLASSMRYWQQLSLLYKNKLLASTPSVANLFVGSDKHISMSSASSSSTVSMSGSSLDKNVSLASSSPNTNNKPPRRASVIVTTTEYNKEERVSTSTPESTTSTESIGSDGSKSDIPVVIDNCNRLIEEHCNRMSEVFTKASQDNSCTDTSNSEGPTTPVVPSLSFIPDSSIAYVNIGNNNTQGTKKSGGNGREGKGKTKKRKTSKNV